MQILARRFDPRIVDVRHEIATVYVDGGTKRDQRLPVVIGAGSSVQLVLEVPQIAGDRSCIGMVMAARPDQQFVLLGRVPSAQATPKVAERTPEALGDELGRCVRPERLDCGLGRGTVWPQRDTRPAAPWLLSGGPWRSLRREQ